MGGENSTTTSGDYWTTTDSHLRDVLLPSVQSLQHSHCTVSGNQPPAASLARHPYSQVPNTILVVPLQVLPADVHRFGAVPHSRVQQHLNVVAKQATHFSLTATASALLPLLHKLKQLSDFVFAERWAWLTLLPLV